MKCERANVRLPELISPKKKKQQATRRMSIWRKRRARNHNQTEGKTREVARNLRVPSQGASESRIAFDRS